MSLLSRVTSSAPTLPSRVFLYAREKWGKSSLFAHAPGAVFFMTRGETGLVELIAGGRVPPTPHFQYDESDPPTWRTLRDAVRELVDAGHQYKALVIDTANGAEILCQEHVRQTQFNGSQAKFASYGKGWDACRVQWLGLLQDLDELRARRKMSIVLLAHTRVKKFDDPTQEDGYDKYQPACQDKLWDLTHKWADIICFGHFKAETYETESGKTKARASVRRVICFDQAPTWEAGNRYGVSGELDVSGGAGDGFKRFAGAVAKARAANTPKPPASPPPVQTPPPPPPPAPATQQAPPPATTPTNPEPGGDDGADDHDTPVVMPAADEPTFEPTSVPEPAPAAASPLTPVPSWLVDRVIALLGEATDVSWPDVRDGKPGIAAKCGIPAGNPKLKIRDLTAAQGGQLREELEKLAAAKEARKRKPKQQPEAAGVGS